MKGCGPGVAVLRPGLCNLSPAIPPHTWTPDCSQRRSAQRMCPSKVGGGGSRLVYVLHFWAGEISSLYSEETIKLFSAAWEQNKSNGN